MKPSRVKEVLQNLLSTKWPVFIWGAPGIGKSSIVREVAQDDNFSLTDIRASLLDPTDLRGIPVVENETAKWCPPSFLPREEANGVLFFDELNAAPPLVQASLYQLTLDKRIGEYTLPDGWRIVAAGNRAEDASITFRMPAALANRFIHLDFEVNFSDWRTWAIVTQIHPLVLGFLSLRQELLFDASITTKGFPTPRSWEMVSDVLKTYSSFNETRDILLGIIGEGASTEFIGYCETAISEKAIRKIMGNPEHAKLPTKLSDQYALISYLTSMAQTKQNQSIAAIILNRLSPELAILLLRNILHIHPSFVLDPNVRKFMSHHKDLVA